MPPRIMRPYSADADLQASLRHESSGFLKRCAGPKPSHLVRVGIDLSALLELAIPPPPPVCHPVPRNWVAKSVAIRLPAVLRSLRSTKMGCFEVTKALFAIMLSISVASCGAAPHSNANIYHSLVGQNVV